MPGRLAVGGVALEHQPQADQGQPGLVRVDHAHLVDDQRREPASSDDGDRVRVAGGEFGRHPPGDSLDLPGEPEDDSRLQRLDRVLADHVIRPGQLDLQQLRGAPRERIDGDLDARRERAADELASRADRVEVRRGPEVDDHGRPAEQVDGGERIHDPVAADLLGVVHPHRHAGLHPGLHDHRRDVAVVAAEHLPHLVQDGRHRRAQRDSGDVRVLELGALREQALQDDRQLIGGAVGDGGDAPVLDHLLAVEDAEHGVGVAHIDRQQHDDCTPASRPRRG